MARKSRPAPRIPVRILEIQRRGGRASKVALGAGIDQGVRVGFTGVLLTPKGSPLAGMSIIQVEPKISLADPISVANDIDEHAVAIIEMPIENQP